MKEKPEMTAQTASSSYSPPVPAGAEAAVCQALQGAVVLMVDLQLQGKQAHWNVVGRSFRSLHTHLDDIVDVARDAADTFAERMRALGAYPDARLGVVASTSTLLAAPEGQRSTEQAARAVSTRLRLASEALRHAHSTVETLDPPTADLINQVVVDVEKHAWMLEAEVAPHGTDPS
ncbi:DNA starvation/stationary phase protection protein [Phycicoccus ginsengisoli]